MSTEPHLINPLLFYLMWMWDGKKMEMNVFEEIGLWLDGRAERPNVLVNQSTFNFK